MIFTVGDLFAGYGGFSLGFERAGFDVRWHVQWEPDEKQQTAQKILRRHWPAVPLYGDVHECGAHNLESVDVITFGSPCQDLSVAGRRRGLQGDRSVLFYEGIRIVSELKPALALWENPDGALSNNAGRDFACILLAFQELGARDIGWATLDARYFGVPQRRRRVYLVADFTGDRAAEILFEPESVRWNPAEGGEAGARTAATLTAGSAAGRSVNRLDGTLTTGKDVADSLTSSCAKTADSAEHHAGPVNLVFGTTGQSAWRSDRVTLAASDDNGTNAVCVTGECTHALTCEGSDASDDGTGRGTPIVCIKGAAIGRKDEHGPQRGEVRDDGIAYTLNTTEVHANGVNLTPFDTTQITSDKNYSQPRAGDPCHPLAAGAHPPAIAFAWQQGDDSKHGKDGRGRSWVQRAGDYAAGLSVTRHDAVAGVFGARRLTPLECERLMGLPDLWTAFDERGNPISDSARYRVIGNGVAIPVVEWLAHRIRRALEGETCCGQREEEGG